ncbi:hypothetical protein BC938DRAFT_482173 [Jimgerdemannia flammicorona]|uniref:Uncharacterized protein n=1 Tax=Jimgerdemannia flammicorona TaxID=994334 RepID=A0A433R0P9_9FUNG|nr:hypothetical protein BC938DRAFT_482173 [Jimgerdemannia flammicorona]
MSLLRRSLSRAFSTSVATRSNVNKAILIGNVGSDCEVKQISEEKTVTTYSLATSEMRKDKEGTSTHDVSSFEGDAVSKEMQDPGTMTPKDKAMEEGYRQR